MTLSFGPRKGGCVLLVRFRASITHCQGLLSAWLRSPRGTRVLLPPLPLLRQQEGLSRLGKSVSLNPRAAEYPEVA